MSEKSVRSPALTAAALAASTLPDALPARVPPSHVPELDGIRGIAIFGVMALHFIGLIHPQTLVEGALYKLSSYGNWGVDLFFVLSGFLITGILHDTKGSERYFRNFYSRRTLRIFPLYYVVLFVLLVLLPEAWVRAFMPELAAARGAQIWLWTYLTNVYLAREGAFIAIPYVSHFWSLAVEEHFYLVWPFVIARLSRENAQRVCIALALGAFGLRISLEFAGFTRFTTEIFTLTRLDALCVGSWFALAGRSADAGAALARWVRRALLPVAAVVVLAFAAAKFDKSSVVIHSTRAALVALIFGLLTFNASRADGVPQLRALLRMAWLRALGKYSYGLYVFHGIIAYVLGLRNTERALTSALGSHALAVTLLISGGVAASIIISVASYELFERHFLKLKRLFA